MGGMRFGWSTAPGRVRAALAALAVLTLPAAAGCGSSAPAGLTPSASTTLRHELAAVRSAAAEGNRSAALSALSRFESGVRQNAGRLSAAQLTALRTGAARLRARIQQTASPAPAETTPTTTTTSPTATTTTTTTPAPAPAPSPAPGPPGPGPGHGPGGHGPPGHEPGHGHGHGAGHGDPGGGDGGD